MLVLTRRLDERIVIGTDVEVKVLGVTGDHVKLGVTAPRHIPVHRGEVFEALQAANRAAAEALVPDTAALRALLARRGSDQPRA